MSGPVAGLSPGLRRNRGGRVRAAGFACLVALIVWGASVSSATAQQPETPSGDPAAVESPAPAPATDQGPLPISAAEIPSRAADLGRLLQEVEGRIRPDAEVVAISSNLIEAEHRIDALAEDASVYLDGRAPLSLLEDAETRSAREAARVESWVQALALRVVAVESEAERVKKAGEVWRLTLESAGEAEFPPALEGQVRVALASIGRTGKSVQAQREEYLTLQAEVAALSAPLADIATAIQEGLAERQRGLLSFDSPPLWRALVQPDREGRLAEQIYRVRRESTRAVLEYVGDEGDRFLLQAGLLIVVLVFLVNLRRRAAGPEAPDGGWDAATAVLRRPLACAFLLTGLVSDVIHTGAPTAFRGLVFVVILVGLLRVLALVVPGRIRPGLYLMVLIFVLYRAYSLLPVGSLLGRFLILALGLLGAGGCLWLVGRLTPAEAGEGARRGTFWTAPLRIAAAVLAVSVVAGVAGASALAAVLTVGVLAAIYWGIILWTCALVVRAMIAVGLRTATAGRLGMVRSQGERIRSFFFRVVNWLAVLLWIWFSLEAFGLGGAALNGLWRTLGAELKVGNLTIVPGNLLLFVIALVLSFKLSRFLRFVLEEDVLPRVSLPRGVPAAVSKGTHYVVLVVGFLIAAAAARVDLSRITLLVGALGVGIGFGLQTVVSNFVSGLILLFERPIQVGDRIQLGDLSGRVMDIGMRASIVRTWQGAEVIVPNSMLVQSEVTNWTLSDERRRFEVRLGVAFDTDPDAVIELMASAAANHPDVLDDPAPLTLFLGYGESTLDFELRAWTATDFVRVQSEVTLALVRAVREQRIVIPYPQRELHVREPEPERSA